MSADNRSVHTDALQTLGTIIESGGRDAIHLAVEPVVAGTSLIVGHDVGIGKNGKAYHESITNNIKLVGIVDPFLKNNVKAGEMFWLIVYPRQITSLRHVWEHPDFPQPGQKPEESLEDKKAYSEGWLRDFVDNNEWGCPSYESIIENYLAGGIQDDSFHFGEDASGSIPDEFWDHMEIVVGHKIKNRPEYFSCSC